MRGNRGFEVDEVEVRGMEQMERIVPGGLEAGWTSVGLPTEGVVTYS
jgi:hypothetical protein